MINKLNSVTGKLLLLFSGAFISFVVVEALLRMAILVPSEFDNDGWWKYRWQMLHGKYKYKVTEFQDQFDPVLGWKPKISSNSVQDFGSLTFNSAGFRSKTEYSQGKSGKKRIMTIGDSFTYGECVGDDETYSAYLEKMTEGSEVLNLGVHGYGLDQELLRLAMNLKYEPDIIIIGFVNADSPRNMLSFREYYKPRFDLVRGKLFLRNLPLPSPEKYLRRIHLLTFDLVSMYGESIINRIYPQKKAREEISLALAILTEMEAKGSQIGAKVFLLYLPSYPEVKRGKSWPQTEYLEFCRNKNANCIDPTRSLNEYIKPYENPSSLFR